MNKISGTIATDALDNPTQCPGPGKEVVKDPHSPPCGHSEGLCDGLLSGRSVSVEFPE
jgi:hypothetical protein